MKHQQSAALFSKAKNVIPGGVNSPVRAFKSVGCDPIFISRAEGSHIYDVDGNDYIDYVGSWGPMILGHCHPKVVEAIQQAATKGASFGARDGALHRNGPDGQFRNRGRHERHKTGSGLHRQGQDPQI